MHAAINTSSRVIMGSVHMLDSEKKDREKSILEITLKQLPELAQWFPLVPIGKPFDWDWQEKCTTNRGSEI